MISTLIMVLIILGLLAWFVAGLTSDSIGDALFIGLGTLTLTAVGVFIGLRVAQPLIRRNREYMEQMAERRSRSSKE